MNEQAKTPEEIGQLIAGRVGLWFVDGHSTNNILINLGREIAAAVRDAIGHERKVVADMVAAEMAKHNRGSVGQEIWVVYTNHRGKIGLRRIIPRRVFFGSNEWYKEPQWLMDVWDCEKQAERSFSFAGMIQQPGDKSMSETLEDKFDNFAAAVCVFGQNPTSNTAKLMVAMSMARWLEKPLAEVLAWPLFARQVTPSELPQ